MPITRRDYARRGETNRGKVVRGIFLRGFILLPIIVLQGCALPVPVQMASWIIDGISYLATEKSVADHGVSLVAQKDCAMWRGFKGETFCREDTEGVYALWDTGATGNSGDLAEDAAPAAWELEGAPEDLAAFETAAGAPEGGNGVAGAAPSTPETETPEAAAGSPEAELPGSLTPRAALPETVTAEPSMPVFNLSRFFEMVVPRPDPFPAVPAQSTDGDMYFVIGNFYRNIEAERLADRHYTLEPAVILAKRDGRQVFRVVVGPFTPADREPLRRAIAGTGILDAWAMRIDPMEWKLAPLRARDVAELP